MWYFRHWMIATCITAYIADQSMRRLYTLLVYICQLSFKPWRWVGKALHKEMMKDKMKMVADLLVDCKLGSLAIDRLLQELRT